MKVQIEQEDLDKANNAIELLCKEVEMYRSRETVTINLEKFNALDISDIDLGNNDINIDSMDYVHTDED